mgnify:CR=1 FL=1
MILIKYRKVNPQERTWWQAAECKYNIYNIGYNNDIIIYFMDIILWDNLFHLFDYNNEKKIGYIYMYMYMYLMGYSRESTPW